MSKAGQISASFDKTEHKLAKFWIQLMLFENKWLIMKRS